MITSPLGQVPAWPVIHAAHGEYAFVNPQKPGTDTPYLFYVDDASGTHVYRFECHHDYYDEDYDLKFSGDLQCVLFAYKNDTVSAFNLLATDTPAEQDSDWHNRGRVLAAQFQDDCLDFPEYSTLRHFRLRGMLLTLGFSDVVWDKTQPGVLAKFRMTLDATPDPAAREPMAAPAEGPVPPAACYPGPGAG